MTESKDLYGIRGSNFSIRIEYAPGTIILHLPEVDNFTIKTFREMNVLLLDWSEFFKTQGITTIWAAIPEKNFKIRKLLNRLGFTFIAIKDNFLVFKYGE